MGRAVVETTRDDGVVWRDASGTLTVPLEGDC